jgi:hypothetical protein
MTDVLPQAIDAALSRDGFRLTEKISSIASDFAARGFSQPSGPMYAAIDELCAERMEQVTNTAIATYRQHLASGGDAASLKSSLTSHLGSRLHSIVQTALHSYNRPASQSATSRMESKMRALVAKAEHA